jgi:hypothetical protein
MTTPSRMVIWVANDRTTEGVVGSGTACDEGSRGRDARRCASRVETASLPLVIARHEVWSSPARRAGRDGRWPASDAIHSRVAQNPGGSRGRP